jgi:succinate dehydrogenase / fumarate reductase, iron-sulfur subunit
MKVIVRISRYQAERTPAKWVEDFAVNVEPSDRLLDTLLFIKRNLDGTLCFRMSCAHGICGSDGMTINGVERLACKTLMNDAVTNEGATVTVESLRQLPLQRDLMVDTSRFFENYRVVTPYLIAAEQTQSQERRQSPEDRSRYDDATKCILCACCYSSCPVVREKNPAFIGPAAVVQAARFVFDSRDMGLKPRLAALDDPNGAWPCENHFNCTRVCPRGIKVTKNINEVKRAIRAWKEAGH